jgi:hypothetical protein
MIRTAGDRTIWLAACACAAIALAAAVALAAPSAALAVTEFRGETDQGRGVELRIDDAALPTRLAIKWKAKCEKQGATFRDGTIYSAFDSMTPTDLADKGSYKLKQRRKIRSNVKVQVSAEQVDPTLWTGTFKARVKVTQRGDVIDRCRLKEIGWSVTSETGAASASGSAAAPPSPQPEDRPPRSAAGRTSPWRPAPPR